MGASPVQVQKSSKKDITIDLQQILQVLGVIALIYETFQVYVA